MLKRLAIVFFLMLSFVGCKQQQCSDDVTFYNGKELFKNHQYYEAFPYLLNAAKSDNFEAQYIIGGAYYYGLGVSQNIKNAVVWFNRAAKNGYAPAMGQLGSIYWKGNVGIRDCSMAEYWFKKAIENGDTNTFATIISYYSSKICGNNLKEKEYYYGLALKNRSLTDLEIGLIDFYMEGGRLGYSRAVELIERNAKDNYNSAGFALGLAYAKGLGVDKNLKKSFKYFHKSALNGNIASQYTLGISYLFGYGVDIDERKAVAWAKKAASLNDMDALRFMGIVYEKGIFFDKDLSTAKKYYSKAVRLGDVKAKRRLEKLNSIN